jgi:uncharacterized protein YdcH (DUF465 family)
MALANPRPLPGTFRVPRQQWECQIMADFRLNLMERFPEYKQVIERLLDSHTDFNSKAHEFTEVQDQLRQAETTGDSPQDAERLRKRHEALRDELIAIMDDHTRI